jgi:hypothetical protein
MGRRSTEGAIPSQIESQDATSEEIRRVMGALGRRGGKIGGKRRAERMTGEQRSDAAALAANARWHPKQPQK